MQPLKTAILILLAAICAGARAHSFDGVGPLPSSALDQGLLAECEANAAAYPNFDPSVQTAIDTLEALGVFGAQEFRNVKIGFCNLRGGNGPVATTSCADDTILLDQKYRDDSESDIILSTLAHEMKHFQHHAVQKRRFGEEYCRSAQYRRDRLWMENVAGPFGDEVAALAFVGRPIEVENECPEPVSVFVDGVAVRRDNTETAKTFVIPPNGTKQTSVIANARTIQYFASGERLALPGDGEERIIDGERRRLSHAVMATRARGAGPFVLRIDCD